MRKKLKQSFIDQLEGIVGSKNFSTNEIDRIVYSRDASVAEGVPEAVVWPESVDEISQLLFLANKERVPVVPRGAGPSLSGGPVPLRGGIVIDLSRMKKIISFNEKDLQIHVEAGCVITQINNFLLKQGMFFPPDPASQDVCTIGGAISTNAGGMRAVKYGVTDRWVQALKIVLPTGEKTWIGTKTRKSVSGYNLAKLIIGSEGTLAVVVEAILSVYFVPETRRMIKAFFNDFESAGQATFQIMSKGLNPSIMEFLDEYTLGAISKYTGANYCRGKAMLLIEVDGSRDEVERKLPKIEKTLKENKGFEIEVAADDEENLKLYSARKAAYPALASLSLTCDVEDATVPVSRLPEMLKSIERISKKYGVYIGTFGHVGDGNIHPNLLYDERKKNEREKVEKAINELFETAIKLGGTLTGEHGIGKAKSNFMKLEHSPESLQLMKSIKKAIDPNNILNPGKMGLM